MINYAVYNLVSGEIKARYSTNECDAMEQLRFFPGCEIYLSCPENCTHIIENTPVTLEYVTSTEEALILLRRQRDALLSHCDWTQVADSPLPPDVKLAWSGYRQELRDITGCADPLNPPWPVPPVY